MKRALAVIGITAVTVLGGCATLSEDECMRADWYLIGLEDGREGRPAEYFQQHQNACFEHDIGVDAQSWADGHADGLEHYCTPLRGWREGRDGNSYRYACPVELEAAFLAAFDAGSQWRDTHRTLESLRAEVAEMENHLVEGAETREERRELIVRIREAQTEIGMLDRELGEIERRAMRRGWMAR